MPHSKFRALAKFRVGITQLPRRTGSGVVFVSGPAVKKDGTRSSARQQRKPELMGTVPMAVRAHPSPKAGERACSDLAEAVSEVEGAAEGVGQPCSHG